ncbi:MAG: hemolysin III family protein [Termitinemataceae bacterium]|nr:MAG: hemolysin III family protein [Termitinemataceae bacterium]
MKVNSIILEKAIPVMRLQTIGEELANSILHACGAVLAAAGFFPLIFKARGFFGGVVGGTQSVTACIIYAVTIFTMFTASTLYHAISYIPAKKILKIFDHSAIYLLIAGTYTPFCFIVLPPKIGVPIFIIEWAFAFAGIILHAVNWHLLIRFEVLIYCVMGWVIAIAAPAVKSGMTIPAIIMLFSGGLFYSVGIIFYKKPQVILCHVIWHVFVLAGAVCHWISVFLIA